MKKLLYLASPFSHSDREVMYERTRLATNATIKLFNSGFAIFSPIAYNGSWIDEDVPGDWNFWKTFDELLISKMDGLIVLMLPGWDKSIGVTAEIEYAKSLNLPIEYVTLEQVLAGDTAHLEKLK